MNDAGWVVSVPEKTIYHMTHALPPIRCAPCAQQATLSYAQATTKIPARTWARVRVHTEERKERPSGGRQALAMTVLTPTTPPELPLHGAPTLQMEGDEHQYVLICNSGDKETTIPAGRPIAYKEQGVIVGGDERTAPASQEQQAIRQTDINLFSLALARTHWPAPQVKRLTQILRKWEVVWQDPLTVGRTDKGEHAIDTGDAKPIAMPLRRLAWVERDQIRMEVDEMKAQGVVTDSNSPWASPPVLVRKKDGTMRFCIDYQTLNATTVPDQYLLPRSDDVLDALETCAFFSVIDLKLGYWQIPMKPQDAEKTAFRTAEGLFHFTVMPFGLRNAPATFQRMMGRAFSVA